MTDLKSNVSNKSGSRKSTSPLVRTKSYFESTTTKVNGKRPGKHSRSTSRGHTQIADTIQQPCSVEAKMSLEDRLNNSNIIDLLPLRSKRAETDSFTSPRSRKRSLSTHEKVSLASTITKSPIEEPAHLTSLTDPPKRVYNPSQVIQKINEKLSQQGHRYSEREIEVMENQIIEERRELMRIFRQLSAQKEKHNKLKKEDLKIQDILSIEKCKQIQDLIPKQALQRIESEIFLATISGPNYNEDVCSYKNYIAAISISTYPVLEGAGRAGDPICDFYYARLFGQGTIFALADGCNWGEAPKQAAQRAASCFVRYIQDRLYRLTDTKQVTKEILKAFAASHGAIMMDKDNTEFFRIGTATLIGGALLPLQKVNTDEETTPMDSPGSKKKSKARKRRKTTEIQPANIISPRGESDPAITSVMSPRERKREKLVKSSGASAPSNRTKRTVDIPGTLQLDPLKPKTTNENEDIAPPRSKQKRCMRKLSPRKNPALSPPHSPNITTREKEIETSNTPYQESPTEPEIFDTPPAELRKLVPGPLVRVRDRKKEHSPLSKRKRTSTSTNLSATASAILEQEEPPLPSPGRHRSFTHYGFAGRNQINAKDKPKLDLPMVRAHKTESSPKVIDETNDWAFVIGSVGDCKVFLYNPTEARITDITSSNRSDSVNAADCGGRLGPCDKQGKPDLRNLFVVSATVQENDLILLVSDGIHDNLDPELLGKKPHEVSSTIEEHKTWDDIPIEISTSLKNSFREVKLGEIINGLSKKTPKNVCKCLAEYCRTITEPSRSFMQNNPSLELPEDYVSYPGKMDHTSCICIKVGSRNNHSDIKLVRDAFVRKETLSITHT